MIVVQGFIRHRDGSLIKHLNLLGVLQDKLVFLRLDSFPTVLGVTYKFGTGHLLHSLPVKTLKYWRVISQIALQMLERFINVKLDEISFIGYIIKL